MESQNYKNSTQKIASANPDTATANTKITSPRPEREQKGKAGRPTLYRPEYCQLIIYFFDIEPYTENQVTNTTKNGTKRTETVKVPNPLRFLIDFERKYGIPHQTLVDWMRFIRIFTQLTCAPAIYIRYIYIIARHIATNALIGMYNAVYAAFVLKNLAGWQDKSVSDTKVFGEVNVTVVTRFGDKDEKPVDKGKVDTGGNRPDLPENKAI